MFMLQHFNCELAVWDEFSSVKSSVSYSCFVKVFKFQWEIFPLAVNRS